MLVYYEYSLIFIFFVISIVVASVLLTISYIVSPKKINAEKVSAYECGFEPFNSAHITFDIHFYIIAILFIIFDLEVAYLFPWIINLGSLEVLNYCAMFLFLVILTLGFIYEWFKGALDWAQGYKISI